MGATLSKCLWAAPSCLQTRYRWRSKLQLFRAYVKFCAEFLLCIKQRNNLACGLRRIAGCFELCHCGVRVEEMAVVIQYVEVQSLSYTDIVYPPCEKFLYLCSGFTYSCFGRSRSGREGVKAVQYTQKSMERLPLTSLDFGFGT